MVDIQILRVGQFVILCVPGELTTMAGRRLREAVAAKVPPPSLPPLPTSSHTDMTTHTTHLSTMPPLSPRPPFPWTAKKLLILAWYMARDMFALAYLLELRDQGGLQIDSFMRAIEPSSPQPPTPPFLSFSLCLPYL